MARPADLDFWDGETDGPIYEPGDEQEQQRNQAASYAKELEERSSLAIYAVVNMPSFVVLILQGDAEAMENARACMTADQAYAEMEEEG